MLLMQKSIRITIYLMIIPNRTNSSKTPGRKDGVQANHNVQTTRFLLKNIILVFRIKSWKPMRTKALGPGFGKLIDDRAIVSYTDFILDGINIRQ